MSYFSQDHLAALTKGELMNLISDTIQAGTHPESGDGFLISNLDRYSGTHLMGLPGTGKSTAMENYAIQDMLGGRSVIYIDPHGDSIDHIVARLPLDIPLGIYQKIHVIDIADLQHPVGLNLLNVGKADPLNFTQAVDRFMHCLEVLWPDIMGQLYLPLTLRMATLALVVNPGSTLIDLYRFLDEVGYRKLCLDNVSDQSVKRFWANFENMPKVEKDRLVMPLKNRVALLIIGRPLVKGIVGQKETTLKFRSAIEQGEHILIKLPLRTLPQDARLIGTLIIASLHETLFSFSNVPDHKRPGFSLYIDEFHNFVSSDFAEMLTEGRKFGCRVTVANQFLGQLPAYLQQAVKTTRTKIYLQLIPEDARSVAPMFQNMNQTIPPENIEPDPTKYLLHHETGNPYVEEFTDCYIRPLQHMVRNGKLEVEKQGVTLSWLMQNLLNVPEPIVRREIDPTHYLNKLLRNVMISGDPNLQIPSQVVYGFSNCGLTFYSTFNWSLKGWLLRDDLKYPSNLVVRHGESQIWVRPPETRREQMFHFLFHLRETMRYLARHPIGQKTIVAETDIARMLVSLPQRGAFIRSGDDIGVIYTGEPLPMQTEEIAEIRMIDLRVHAVGKYCIKFEESIDLLEDKPDLQYKRYTEVTDER